MPAPPLAAALGVVAWWVIKELIRLGIRLVTSRQFWRIVYHTLVFLSRLGMRIAEQAAREFLKWLTTLVGDVDNLDDLVFTGI